MAFLSLLCQHHQAQPLHCTNHLHLWEPCFSHLPLPCFLQALCAAASHFPVAMLATHPPSTPLHSQVPLQSISSRLWCVQSRWSPGPGHPSADASVQLCRGLGALQRCAWWVANQSGLKNRIGDSSGCSHGHSCSYAYSAWCCLPITPSLK